MATCSNLAVLLLLSMIVLGESRVQHKASVVTGNSPGNSETELIDEIVLDSDNFQSIIKKLAELRGQWPFRDKAHCKTMKTRDYDYHRYEHRGESGTSVRRLLHRVAGCGKTKTTKEDKQLDTKSSSDGELEHEARQSRYKRELDSELDEAKTYDLRSVVNQIESIVDDGTINDDIQDSDQKAHLQMSRVVGGRLTQQGAWPWLAAIGRKTSGPKCGGSVIADRWIVTAAHCFQDEEMPCQFNVRVGSRSWFYDEEGTHVDATVEAIYRHPDYEKDTHVNDIALLKLSVDLNLEETSNVNAICLPHRSRSVEPGTVCMAAGWGRTAEAAKASVYESREVEIPVLTYTDKCGDYPRGTMKSGMLCAGYLRGGRDTCQGDSGGPLVYEKDGRWTLLGLTSFGEGCARENYPGIYTDVGHHLRWIASVIDRY